MGPALGVYHNNDPGPVEVFLDTPDPVAVRQFGFARGGPETAPGQLPQRPAESFGGGCGVGVGAGGEEVIEGRPWGGGDLGGRGGAGIGGGAGYRRRHHGRLLPRWRCGLPPRRCRGEVGDLNHRRRGGGPGLRRRSGGEVGDGGQAPPGRSLVQGEQRPVGGDLGGPHPVGVGDLHPHPLALEVGGGLAEFGDHLPAPGGQVTGRRQRDHAGADGDRRGPVGGEFGVHPLRLGQLFADRGQFLVVVAELGHGRWPWGGLLVDQERGGHGLGAGPGGHGEFPLRDRR
jgi:hypothetical protein